MLATHKFLPALDNSREAHLCKSIGISLNSRMMGMAIKWYVQYVVETGQQLLSLELTRGEKRKIHEPKDILQADGCEREGTKQAQTATS